VSLDVLDGTGKVLRHYSSTDPVAPTKDELEKNLIPPYWPLITGPLPVTAGMHRWVWDLHETTPTATHYEYPISAVPHRTPLEPQGPVVLPGTYTVRLTVDGKSESASLTVKMDPRVTTSPEDLKTLYDAQEAMASSLNVLTKAYLAAHSVEEQIGSPQNAAIAAQLAPFKQKLESILEGSEHDKAATKHVPGLNDVTSEASELYGGLQGSDGAPTAAILQSSDHVEHEGTEVLPLWEEFKQTEIPALNKVLQDAHQPAVNLSRAPTNIPYEGDED
jgi:hypothetical protein